MQSMTTAFLNAAKAQNREVRLSVTAYYAGGQRNMTGSEIINIEWHQAMNADALTIGEAQSSYVILTCRPPTSNVISSTSLLVKLGFVTSSTTTYCTVGTFYVTNVESQDNYKTITITAYDKLALLEGDYIPSSSISFPATAQNILNDICSQSGITSDVTMPNVTISAITQGSVNQQIAWLAGLCGKNAYMTYNNHLNFRWYTSSGQTIGKEIQYLSGFVRTKASDFTVHSLLTGTDENPITCGSGTGIVHTNPYMTQQQANSIFNTLNNFTYTPCEVKWRGNPAMEVGDTVLVTDENGTNHTVCIMEQTTVIKGGMSSTIACYGMTDNEIIMHVSPTETRLRAEYKGLIGSLQEATKTIIGENGGYYELLFDSNTGLPRGWSIRNTPTVTSSTKMWLFTNGGLGFSTDGGQTVSNIALTSDGKIVANSITTGLLQVLNTHGGTVFSANMDTGEVVINGSNGNVSFLNCPFEVIREKSFLRSNYSTSDGTRIQRIIGGSITPTSSDYEKYDFNLDGVIDDVDAETFDIMMDSGDFTIRYTTQINVVEGTPLEVSKLFRFGAGQWSGNEIFHVSYTNALAGTFVVGRLIHSTPIHAVAPSVYQDRCYVGGGYQKNGYKIEVSIRIVMNTSLNADYAYLMLTGLPAPWHESALSCSAIGTGNDLPMMNCYVINNNGSGNGYLYIRGNKPIASGTAIAIEGSYWYTAYDA